MSDLFVDNIKHQSSQGSGTITIGASGENVTVPNGSLTGQNYPAFEAKLSSDQAASDGVLTKINCNTEVFDTNGYYDNATNYRFTPLIAGKYYVYGKTRGQSDTSSTCDYVASYIYKNGSLVTSSWTMFRSNWGRSATPFVSTVVDMNGTTDYVELFGTIKVDSGGLDGFLASSGETLFGAYRIGA